MPAFKLLIVCVAPVGVKCCKDDFEMENSMDMFCRQAEFGSDLTERVIKKFHVCLCFYFSGYFSYQSFDIKFTSNFKRHI